ncbi:MAG: ATP-dependent protease LonB [Paenibacillaceae bacterium]
MSLNMIIMLVQVFFAVIIGLYFLGLLRGQRTSRSAIDKESRKELEKLRKLRTISLTQPLSEKTRPASLSDIVGQTEGLKALKAALCGPNPQHVLIYGPPGVGKTAAARVLLHEAKKNPMSPFGLHAKFTEIDATIARFDERGIADPLIGSVHDPIYQGAGAMGVAGIPQPKPGAVTKAHGGILFIDEIGELHPTQMNKLLKVLEDRKVHLESAYYNSEDIHIPQHIHDIFQNGLPADFRLVGATTRNPHEIPAALRSRCMEIFFRPLNPEEIGLIAKKAINKIGFPENKEAVDIVMQYATNGREAVNVIQLSSGLAMTEKRDQLSAADVEWVVNSSQIPPRFEKKIHPTPLIGVVNGLAVYGPNMGSILELEVSAVPAYQSGEGRITLTGIVDEEELGSGNKTLRRKSMARGSVENVMTVLRQYGLHTADYDLHVNFPGGLPIDGPSAGIAIATAIASAIMGIPIDHTIALTGELSIQGKVKPVGGVAAKIEAACQAGVKTVYIPSENWQRMFEGYTDMQIIKVDSLDEVFDQVLGTRTFSNPLPRIPSIEAIPAATISILHAGSVSMEP